MSGCQTCGGFGDRHDPIAHGTGQRWPGYGKCQFCERLQPLDEDGFLPTHSFDALSVQHSNACIGSWTRPERDDQ